ncbi:hypothetical protein B0T26DRAFT_719107 [Lasiosphaeria miniovina]|uniref:Uncharacterized protein n=1 Tax=Lasiosphaeria miniovina TaxID=1954250 RepID=A0AA40ADK6_9PEZI|nr:uncharacterized protein B0T26DRAFT_719107 [Lasiosphaeria miniovina]KAK0713952.1 hypothetical protein B0T26DRAFT_719107 [Lasiosphaeria miniovina]
MPFGIFVGTENTLHVTGFPLDQSRHPETKTPRACLLFLHIHHPELYPSDNTIHCAQTLHNILSVPLVEKHVPKGRVLTTIAQCNRNELPADSTEMVAYAEGGKLAIVALYVVSPGHRAKFLDRINVLSGDEKRQLFSVLSTTQPDKSFITFLNTYVTDDLVDSYRIRSKCHILSVKRKSPYKDGVDLVRRVERGERATESPGSGGDSRVHSNSTQSDLSDISNFSLGNTAPMLQSQAEPSMPTHAFDTNNTDPRACSDADNDARGTDLRETGREFQVINASRRGDPHHGNSSEILVQDASPLHWLAAVAQQAQGRIEQSDLCDINGHGESGA